MVICVVNNRYSPRVYKGIPGLVEASGWISYIMETILSPWLPLCQGPVGRDQGIGGRKMTDPKEIAAGLTEVEIRERTKQASKGRCFQVCPKCGALFNIDYTLHTCPPPSLAVKSELEKEGG
jgi:hypothetical protein